MNEIADFDEYFALISVLLLMAIWGFTILVIDHWVGRARSDLPHPPP